ncbi:Serine/threonine-protein kinase pkn1 [Crateriforma conspicua]|nr:Serine/threonine-protein kinase pkn1 [Crateriforma conspicua]
MHVPRFSLPRPSLFIALAALVGLTTHATAATPGIADEKPADGPSVKVDQGYMVPYTVRIPGTDIEFEMIPVSGGTYQMGSPDSEEDRNDDEGPQVKVEVAPMWVAKTEVTWQQYKEYMRMYSIFKDFEARGERTVSDDNMTDAITAPTELYDPTFTYEYGEEPMQPAVTMTVYAAKQFTKWLSRITNQQFRLPTEAEWEYAARAGTTTAYSFGDTADDIDDYAWYFDNALDGPGLVATKKPNAFGLYDMHGNAAEWVVDLYSEDGYARLADKQPVDAIESVQWPETPWPAVARGGSWEMDPPDLRSAARLASNDDDWKSEDPNFPVSPWWHTSDPSRGVGFRLFRSLEPLADEKINLFWDANDEETKDAVQSRIQGGRGGWGLVDESLPEAIENMDN